MKNLTTKMIIAALAVFVSSCNTATEKQTDTNQDSVKTDSAVTAPTTSSSNFDITTIPVSDKELGTFPFFSLPKDIMAQNKPIQRNFDRLFFPINGVFQPIEGKVWKSGLVMSKGTGDSWSLPYFEKSYDDAIRAVGGVNIYDGKVSKEEIDRIKDKATYFGEEGSIDYWNDPVKVYVIRRANGEEIYVQLSGNSAMGNIQVLQKEAFKQTISILKADQIQKELTEKGKAVVYINFDTDKASLKADGKEAVMEITKALTADKTLKIAINGYTDNTGDATHNLQLSQQRAGTVKNELVKAGIDAGRLSSGGFGQSNPIADNNSEEGKAKNRRVELLKQ